MDIEESKQTPSHLASVFADILNPKDDIKTEPSTSSKKKELKRKKGLSSKKRKKDNEEAASPSNSSSTKAKKKAKHEWDNLFRVKPDPVTDRELERSLLRIATKGVVQLFNAIREHQSRVGEAITQSGTTTVKMERAVKSIVDKDKFLDRVSKSARKEKAVTNGVKKERVNTAFKPKEIKKEVEEPESAAKWDVLRDDFLMNSAKDWDKEDSD